MKNLFLVTIISLCVNIAEAQWTSNTDINTSASDLTGVLNTNMATTQSGKTYITYFSGTPGNYVFWVQMIDRNGYRKFGNNGVQLLSTSASWISKTYLTTDSKENLYITFCDIATVQHYIQKVDTSGNKLFGINGKPVNLSLPGCLKISQDSTILFSDIDGNIFKYSALGDSIWTRHISLDTSEVKDIMPLSDGRFYALLLKNITNSGGYVNHFLQLYNSDGTPVWTNPVQLSMNYSNLSITSASLVLGENNTVYSATSFPISGSSAYIFIQKTDISGNVLWGNDGIQTISTPSIVCYNFSLKYISTLNQLICNIGCLNYLQDSSSILLQKIDANGNLLLSNSGITLVPMSDDEPYLGASELCSDMNNVLCYKDEQSNKVHSLKSDLSGNIIWQKIIGVNVNFNNAAGDLMMGKDGDDWLVFSFTEDRTSLAGGNEKLYVQNIKCDGNFTLVNEINNIDYSLTLFPNPASELLNITSDKFHNNLQVEIFDINGRLLTNEQFNGHEIKLDVSSFKNGIYFIHLSSPEINRYLKFIKM